MRPASRRPGASIAVAVAGFSLTEALVAAVVLGLALMGSTSVLRAITNMLGRSGDVNAINLAIDNDISEIKRLASLYTACLVPTGSLLTEGQSCGTGITPDQAAYFFPVNPGTNEANITAFFAACSAASAGSHITQGFITAIGQLPAVGPA